ncbi:(d)CMP kinase [Virgibacillus sp. LDC-1]|uniref:(d)CMP kinase n=1 Tax=Virgibacillus sp. LDC-1 TaxID=3039856 RepID=UPI0024DEA1AF|nr:(d)CMP kinase [Virgibacillus sp. LDC-1]
MVANNKKLAIAIDGPAAAGKSTVAKIVAHKLTYIYIDTGAMYRALTLKALQEHLSVEEEEALSVLLSKSNITLEQGEAGQRVFLDGKDVTEAIRTNEVTNNVSFVAKHRAIREEMVKRQQKLATNRGVVMDGRDIGTHVIPDAEVKIFLLATAEERARRRHEENIKKGFPSNLQQLKEEIEKRDQIDSKREVAPLIKATDAIEIDTTSLTIQEVADRILQEVSKKLAV